jgi:hypothetical protein
MGMRGGMQASVNPKAETVDELQARRKNLHLGMCKLLCEDLAYLIEQRLVDLKAKADAANIRSRIRSGINPDADAAEIGDRIIMEYDGLTRQHEHIEADVFNADDEYKAMMNEAIDGKAQALLKMDVYLESVAAASDGAALDRIRDAPLIEFAYPHTVLRLRTGISQFPWAAVVRDKSPEIDLGEWDATKTTAQAREFVADALGGNTNIRLVTLMGVKLELTEGWETIQLDWAENAAVKAVPATVALILRNCRSVTNLNLRYS